MAVPKSSKYLIGAGPTNWVEGLEKYYAEDALKREKHGEALRQRDAEALQIQKEESPIRMLQQVAEFSTTASKLFKQNKAAQEKKDNTQKLIAGVHWAKLSEKDKGVLFKQIEDFKALEIDYDQWKKLIRDSTELSPEAKKLLTTQHGGYLAHLHEHMGWSRVKGMKSVLDKRRKNEDGFEARWDRAKQDGKEYDFLRDAVYGELEDLKLSDEIVATQFSKPIQKWLDTKNVMSHLRGNAIYHSLLEKDDNLKLDKAYARSETDPNAVTFELQQQLRGLGNDKGGLVNRLQRSARSGQLKQEELNAARDGQLDPSFNYPGKTGKDLLSEEQWQSIEHLIREKNEATLLAKQKAWEPELVRALLAMKDPNKTAEEQTAIREQVLFGYEQAGGDLNNENYKALKRDDPYNQTQEAFETQYESWKPFVEGTRRGELLRRKEDIKTITNHALRKQLTALVNEDQAYYREVGLPDTYENQKKVARSEILNSDPIKKSKIFGDNFTGEFSGIYAEVQDHLINQRFLFAAKARQMYPNDVVQSKEAGRDMYEQYLLKEGFNMVDDGSGNTAIGKLSPTMTGQYKRFRIYDRSDNNYQGHTEDNNKVWSQQYVNANLEAKGSKDVLLNTPGFLNQNALTNILRHNPLDAKGKLRPTYTPELIAKANMLGVQPGTLLRYQLQAFINDPNNAQISQTLGLADMLDKLYTPDVDLEQAVIALRDKDLLFKFKKGIDKMSYNDITNMQHRLLERTRGETRGVPNLPVNYASTEQLARLRTKWYREGKWDGLDEDKFDELLMELQSELQQQRTPK